MKKLMLVFCLMLSFELMFASGCGSTGSSEDTTGSDDPQKLGKRDDVQESTWVDQVKQAYKSCFSDQTCDEKYPVVCNFHMPGCEEALPPDAKAKFEAFNEEYLPSGWAAYYHVMVIDDRTAYAVAINNGDEYDHTVFIYDAEGGDLIASGYSTDYDVLEWDEEAERN